MLPSEWQLFSHADETEALRFVSQGCTALLGSAGGVSLLASTDFPHQEL